MSQPVQRRMAFEPVHALCPSLSELAAITGVSRRSLTRWVKEGAIPIWSADRIACRLGKHPTELWEDWDDVS
jgi:hypothetical protein